MQTKKEEKMNNEKEYISSIENWINSISNLAIAFSEILRSQNQKIIASSSMRYGKILLSLSYDVVKSEDDKYFPVFNPNVLDCFKQDFLVIASYKHTSDLEEERVNILASFNNSFIDLLKKDYLYFKLSKYLERYGKAWYFIGGILHFGNSLQVRDMFSLVENYVFNFQFHFIGDFIDELHFEKLINSLRETAPHTVKLLFEGKI